MNKLEMIKKMNEAGRRGKAFVFVIDFEMKDCIFKPLTALDNSLFFCLNNLIHLPKKTTSQKPFYFNKIPVSFSEYKKAFNTVRDNIQHGNTYLTNLTFPTLLHTDLRLEDIFMRSTSPYKLLVANNFVCFSPECFVKIVNGVIASFPMKGTIDSAIPDAERLILNDIKETAEHYTIVDLIRNDLSQVANEVQVEQFRYIDKISTNGKTLLQVSSVIKGQLPADYNQRLGEIIFSLLPAGSISGAPKKSTIDLIRKVERDSRNYYTGIFGVFDGANLDSAVMIRYIEKTSLGLVFRSGGGITTNSKAESEYQELIDKVYVPFT
ncbi:MAG: aminodeoxychorismate synthase component I [Bacteroidales bacterium]|jgi:para-aminobenzoate synthetase component 1|nr:aminodeoxychorismate synthase component I [Bacteroidales bacterium]